MEDEQELIECYFSRGFQYKTIIDFLSKRHGLIISERTLRNCLKEYGLQRRSPVFGINEIRHIIRDKLNGTGNMGGIVRCGMLCEHQVPRHIVEELMRELDPDSCETRRAKPFA